MAGVQTWAVEGLLKQVVSLTRCERHLFMPILGLEGRRVDKVCRSRWVRDTFIKKRVGERGGLARERVSLHRRGAHLISPLNAHRQPPTAPIVPVPGTLLY